MLNGMLHEKSYNVLKCAYPLVHLFSFFLLPSPHPVFKPIKTYYKPETDSWPKFLPEINWSFVYLHMPDNEACY